MPPSVDPPSSAEAREIPSVTYVISGTGTPNDGKSADGIVLVDPTTAAPMEPGAITFSSLSIADGADAALGSTTDDAGDTTVIGRLQALILVLNTLIAQGARGSTTFSQVTVGSTPVLLLAANPSRKSAVIQNVAGGSALTVGKDANVVASSPGEGQYLGLVVSAGGDAEDTDGDDNWYGVCATGSADVRIVEVS